MYSVYRRHLSSPPSLIVLTQHSLHPKHFSSRLLPLYLSTTSICRLPPILLIMPSFRNKYNVLVLSSPPSSSPFSATSFPPPLFLSPSSSPSSSSPSFPPLPSRLLPFLLSSPLPFSPFPSLPLPPLPPPLPPPLLPSLLFLILLTFFAPQTFALPSSSPSFLHAPVPPHKFDFSSLSPFLHADSPPPTFVLPSPSSISHSSPTFYVLFLLCLLPHPCCIPPHHRTHLSSSPVTLPSSFSCALAHDTHLSSPLFPPPSPPSFSHAHMHTHTHTHTLHHV